MIFPQSLGTLDGMSTEKAIRTVANYVRAMQEQLEYTLTTLDSDNVIEIDTDKTAVSNSDGGVSIKDGIKICGNGYSAFTVESGNGGGLTFRMTAEDGSDIVFASGAVGQIELRSRGPLSLSGGSWNSI